MIEVKDLTKNYGKKIAVNNISFLINQGEIVGFLGPNGAGKTTTMNMLTGYISSNSGTISVGGFDILERPIEAKKQIGYLPEQPPLYHDMTVKEYLNFVFDLKKCKFKKKDHIQEVCEVVKISSVYNRL
ncbi:MAG: transporter, partial [Clostridia bacterium]|nr:transporter [Clostridia bacterium]